MRKVRRALITVSDKRGVEEFALGLQKLGVEILATGGTAAELRGRGVKVRKVADFTGFPEVLEGRLKTLHPKIMGGILFERGNRGQEEEARALGIEGIDMVVVNLHPLPEGAGTELHAMDVGGHALLRAAIKNREGVLVVVSPDRYRSVLDALAAKEGIGEELRKELALEAMEHALQYDGRVLEILSEAEGLPSTRALLLQGGEVLRYGENPHQAAVWYRDPAAGGACVGAAEQIHGKPLSFNNVVDFDAACDLACRFLAPAAVIIKHANPCGAAVGKTLPEAFERARSTDPDASFGGIVGLNRVVDGDLAELLAAFFLEGVIAPSFSEEAMKRLTKKKKLRLLVVPGLEGGAEPSGSVAAEVRTVGGGFLLQERDRRRLREEDLRVVTRRAPTPEEHKALRFAQTVVAFVKSNAVVFATAGETVGVGAGQMSRVDACRLAVKKARKPLGGTVLASDGFFPFRDGVEVAAEAGATAVIQPGGSIRDREVVEACNELGLAMVFTGFRSFRH